jgi:hypothetical protein
MLVTHYPVTVGPLETQANLKSPTIVVLVLAVTRGTGDTLKYCHCATYCSLFDTASYQNNTNIKTTNS